ncbi:unnamed protein product [Amoebophrya sp. A25]|nr:unnamed protein product [Amoebophrya sp. A25]|eukprot:GSA25T00012306001.1
MQRSSTLSIAPSIDIDYEETPEKEHWWWDTQRPNDGGTVNDAKMRKWYKTVVSSLLADSDSLIADFESSFGFSQEAERGGTKSEEQAEVDASCGENKMEEIIASTSAGFALTTTNLNAIVGRVDGIRIDEQVRPFWKSILRISHTTAKVLSSGISKSVDFRFLISEAKNVARFSAAISASQLGKVLSRYLTRTNGSFSSSRSTNKKCVLDAESRTQKILKPPEDLLENGLVNVTLSVSIQYQESLVTKRTVTLSPSQLKRLFGHLNQSDTTILKLEMCRHSRKSEKSSTSTTMSQDTSGWRKCEPEDSQVAGTNGSENGQTRAQKSLFFLPRRFWQFGPVRTVFARPFVTVIGGSTEAKYLQQAVYLANTHYASADTRAPVLTDKMHLQTSYHGDTNLVLLGTPMENKVTAAIWQEHPYLRKVIDFGESSFAIFPSIVNEAGADHEEAEGFRFSSTRESPTTPPRRSTSHSLHVAEFQRESIGLLAWVPLGSRGRKALVIAGTDEHAVHTVAHYLGQPTIPPMMRAPFTNQVPDYIVLDAHETKRKGVGGFLMAGFWGTVEPGFVAPH